MYKKKFKVLKIILTKLLIPYEICCNFAEKEKNISSQVVIPNLHDQIKYQTQLIYFVPKDSGLELYC